MTGNLLQRASRASLTGLAVLLYPTLALAAPPASLKIPDSTPVKLTLIDRLNSANSVVDDPVHFEVSEDVKVGGMVVISRGAMASGHVVEVERRGRMGRAGRIIFSADFVRTPDGTEVPLRDTTERSGRSSGRKLPPLSPLRLMEHGKSEEIPQGTNFVAYVKGTQEISIGDPSPPAPSTVSPTTAQPAAPPSVANSSEVKFTSTPDHADITVDGKFLGTTPSTIPLAPGDHSITIEKTGFKAWQRIVTLLTGGRVTLDVTLEKTL